MSHEYSFGYLGIAECSRCNVPAHTFVYSGIQDITPRCKDCLYNSLDSYVSYNNLSEGVRTRLLVDRQLIRDCFESMFPILSEPFEFMCQACERPQGESPVWRLTDASVLDDNNEHRTIIVHNRCTDYCEDCEQMLAVSHQRYFRGEWKIGYDKFIDVRRIDGTKRCTTCYDKYKHGREMDFFYCEHCEDEWHDSECRYYLGQNYCTDCYQDNAYDCEDCGESCWSGDDHYCESESDDDYSSLIHSYSYRPSPAFFGKGKYHLGFELEVEARNVGRHTGAEVAQQEFGAHVYLKDDGSLNDGFEIVTHPHTLTEYQTNFNWAGLAKLKREGLRSWNTSTCGLHVHISREAFSVDDVRLSYDQRILRRQAHELRFMKLIYDNERQVCRIAGRSDNQYATFGDKGQLVRKLKQGYQENGRYSAINTENDATLEVRVFKGSLRPERVLSALEFVTASVEYTRNLSINGKNIALSWLRFTGYVAEHAETYPNLALIMNESFNSDYPANQD